MPRQLDNYILSIQTGAEAYATNTYMGFEAASEDQVHRIRITLDDYLADKPSGRLDHDSRLRLLRRVFPISGLTGLAPESTRDLSKAQACALIDALYGHPEKGLTRHTPLSEDGVWFIKQWSLAVLHERQDLQGQPQMRLETTQERRTRMLAALYGSAD